MKICILVLLTLVSGMYPSFVIPDGMNDAAVYTPTDMEYDTPDSENDKNREQWKNSIKTFWNSFGALDY